MEMMKRLNPRECLQGVLISVKFLGSCPMYAWCVKPDLESGAVGYLEMG